MSALTYRFDYREVERGLAALAATTGRGARSAFAALKPAAKKDHVEHAQRQEGPEGPWQPRAASSVRRARNTKGKRKRAKTAARRILNTLPRRTISVRATGSYLFVASKVPWAGIHQWGGTAGRGSKIPARPFLWFSPEFYEKALGLLRGRMLHAWRRA